MREIEVGKSYMFRFASEFGDYEALKKYSGTICTVIRKDVESERH